MPHTFKSPNLGSPARAQVSLGFSIGLHQSSSGWEKCGAHSQLLPSMMLPVRNKGSEFLGASSLLKGARLLPGSGRSYP